MIVKFSAKHLSGPVALKRFGEQSVRDSLTRVALVGGHVEATLGQSHGVFTVKYTVTTASGDRLVCESQHTLLPNAIREATARLVMSLSRLKERQRSHRDRATPRHRVDAPVTAHADTWIDEPIEWDDGEFDPEVDRAGPFPTSHC